MCCGDADLCSLYLHMLIFLPGVINIINLFFLLQCYAFGLLVTLINRKYLLFHRSGTVSCHI